MPTNNKASISYQALDRCLSNWTRRCFYIEDLVQTCHEALYQYNVDNKKECGVKKRQVQVDLKFLESEEGYIDAIKDGHRKYYRYHHRGDSFKNKPINQEELNLIHDALLTYETLQRCTTF